MGVPKALTLGDLIRHGQMEPRHKVRLRVDLLRALGEQHRQGRRRSQRYLDVGEIAQEFVRLKGVL